MNHTPTPWYFSGCDIKAYGDALNDTGLVIADCAFAVDENYKGDEAQDNAKFIVTACNAHEDLLEAAKRVLKNDPSDSDFVESIKALGNAIAKAEGKA